MSHQHRLGRPAKWSQKNAKGGEGRRSLPDNRHIVDLVKSRFRAGGRLQLHGGGSRDYITDQDNKPLFRGREDQKNREICLSLSGRQQDAKIRGH